MPINALGKKIRIFASGIKGFGHCRVGLTMIQWLREQGYSRTIELVVTEGALPTFLRMIPEWKDQGELKEEDTLGLVKVMVVASNVRELEPLEKIDIVVITGLDAKLDEFIKFLNGEMVALLQPTDWQYDRDWIKRYCINAEGEMMPLDPSLRLSSSSLHLKLDYPKGYKLPPGEEQVLKILDNDKLNTVLLYGLTSTERGYGAIAHPRHYPARPDNVLRILLCALADLGKKTGKPSIILSPDRAFTVQYGERDYDQYGLFLNSLYGLMGVIRSEKSVSMGILDIRSDKDLFGRPVLKGIDELKAGDVVIVATGPLSYKCFDKALEGVTVSIVEGANATELCKQQRFPWLSLSSVVSCHPMSKIYGELPYGPTTYKQIADLGAKLCDFFHKLMRKDKEVMMQFDKLFDEHAARGHIASEAFKQLGLEFPEPKVESEGAKIGEALDRAGFGK